ncbi:hypothetical protein DXG03_008722 [Asterophora parasitica]|uniref:Uncharacterized protein n=1 Tax=Asterophora parasitica TaxID=117018 RepID=A0A9P7G5L6_9AGAR|nr:hypothetical protein DXG03_008722 [Asterophora parasitica]
MPASPVSYKSLSEHLGDLAKGTTIMGKPQRHWPEPRFGFVADHFVGADVSRPPRTSSFDLALNLGARTPEPADKSGENQVPVIIAPRPIVPLTAVRAAFEVRAYAATLPEVFLTPLSATFDDAASDENARISAATRDHSDGNGPAIPEPHMRGKREPFGVLHFDKVSSPFSQRMSADIDTKEPASPGRSDTGSDGSAGGAKGWERMRAKAPPAITTNVLAEQLQSTMLAKVAKEGHDENDVSPNRASLLRILNEGY